MLFAPLKMSLATLAVVAGLAVGLTACSGASSSRSTHTGGTSATASHAVQGPTAGKPSASESPLVCASYTFGGKVTYWKGDKQHMRLIRPQGVQMTITYPSKDEHVVTAQIEPGFTLKQDILTQGETTTEHAFREVAGPGHNLTLQVTVRKDQQAAVCVLPSGAQIPHDKG